MKERTGKYELIDKETGKVYYDDDGQCDVVVEGKDWNWIQELCFSMNRYKENGRFFVRQQQN